MIKFDKLKESEIDIFFNFHKRLNDLIGFTDDSLDNDEIKAYIKEDLMSESGCCIVAKENDEPIGLISVDFSNELDFNERHYTAAIPLIFVEEKKRNGILSYDLLMLALEECKKRGTKSIAISVEDNNPHKFLHFAIADTLIDVNQEYLTDDKTVTQYILGISNINDILDLSFSKLATKISKTRKNFQQRLKELQNSFVSEKES